MRYGYSEALAHEPDAALLARSAQLKSKLERSHRWNARVRSMLPSNRGVRLARKVSRALLPPLVEPVLCQTLYGFELLVSPADGLNYYYDGCYEAGTLHVMKYCLRPGDTFVDVGASIGQMTMFAAQKVEMHGRVLAFEPHPGRFASLATAIVRNRARNVTAFRSGLGDASGELKLFTSRASPSLVGDDSETEFVRVQIERLDKVLAKERVGSVRMMKIDVEGFELAVLRGAPDLLSGPEAPILSIEHERYGGDPLEPLEFLKGRNAYEFFQLAQKKARPSVLRRLAGAELPRLGDNIFCLLPGHVQDLASRGLVAR